MVEQAKQELSGLADVVDRNTWRRLGARPDSHRLAIICSIYGLLTIVLILGRKHVRLWSSFAPPSPADFLETLWQVQTGLVSLGFPLLLLLIQFSRDEGVTALRSSEVLARETVVRPAMEMAAVGLIVAGGFAAWLHSDEVVAAALLAVTLPTVLALLYCYFVALNLHMDPDRLRQRSSELLQDKLRSSMREVWQIQRANAILLDSLSDIGVTRAYLPPEPGDPAWWTIDAPTAGRIADINIHGLRSLLASLPAVQADASERTDAPTPGRQLPDVGSIQIVRLCDDVVTRGDPVLILRREAFAFASPPDLNLAGAVRIDPDAN